MSIERACEVLEVSPAASIDNIDQAYRDMAAVWHPDRFEGSPRL
ncbi:J domain-containing protein, partial [bacterium]|nr:J domain-containing protein [bacterium]